MLYLLSTQPSVFVVVVQFLALYIVQKKYFFFFKRLYWINQTSLY